MGRAHGRASRRRCGETGGLVSPGVFRRATGGRRRVWRHGHRGPKDGAMGDGRRPVATSREGAGEVGSSPWQLTVVLPSITLRRARDRRSRLSEFHSQSRGCGLSTWAARVMLRWTSCSSNMRISQSASARGASAPLWVHHAVRAPARSELPASFASMSHSAASHALETRPGGIWPALSASILSCMSLPGGPLPPSPEALGLQGYPSPPDVATA